MIISKYLKEGIYISYFFFCTSFQTFNQSNYWEQVTFLSFRVKDFCRKGFK